MYFQINKNLFQNKKLKYFDTLNGTRINRRHSRRFFLLQFFLNKNVFQAGMYGTALATVASYEKRNKVILFTIEEDCVIIFRKIIEL